MDTENTHLVTGSAKIAFEVAVEQAFQDFFSDAWGPATYTLADFRILSALRALDITKDASTSTAIEEATAAREPLIIFIGTNYKRIYEGADSCTLDTRVEVNLKHHAASVYYYALNHVRAALSRAYVDTVLTEINANQSTVFIQSIESADDPGDQNGFQGTCAVCTIRRRITGYLR